MYIKTEIYIQYLLSGVCKVCFQCIFLQTPKGSNPDPVFSAGLDPDVANLGPVP